MICPYCVEEIPANSLRHAGCEVLEALKDKDPPQYAALKDKNFPQYYVDFHAAEGAEEPVVLSVVGFVGHGKTVYLCALFDFLDNVLVDVWPDFFNRVLDQESVNTLSAHRLTLRNGKLPGRTDPETFPRPGIFRLTNMPRPVEAAGQQPSPPELPRMPTLKDTTVLIYDPPGEAFVSEDRIVELARFVKRSDCVLFLIDLVNLADSVSDEMAKLLDTYLLGMRRMEIAEKSQHLIVVYTKSDELHASVPEFQNFLQEHPELKQYLAEQKPKNLNNPNEHLHDLENVSRLLGVFTKDKLKAKKFINEAKDYFKSIRYTAVSSLGAPPEGYEENGKKLQRLKYKMSPRSVADPLLYVLSKSIREEEAPPPQGLPQWVLIVGALAIILIVLLILMSLFKTNAISQTNSANTPPVAAASPLSTTASKPGPSATPSSTPAGLPKKPVSLSRTATLLKEPTGDGPAILKLPRSTMVSPIEEKTDGDGKTWVRIRIENQNCQIGRANFDSCQSVKIASYAGWVRVMLDADRTILSWASADSQQATVERNANLRNKAGDYDGAAILILYKDTKVSLTEEEETIGSYLWKKVEIKNQSCCVSPPPVISDKESVFTVRVASTEGWIEKDSLNL
jgi:hypothetical protein